MKQNPNITIITVCLNAQNLHKTCESIVNQTFQGFEWVVIDGGSNKKTLDIFEKYKDRINFFVSEKDNGIYNAMNKGILHSNGQYLLFLNAGDWLYDNNVLENFVKAGLDKDIIYANIWLNEFKYVDSSKDVLDTTFWMERTLPHQATLIKKTLFYKYGLYNEDLKIASDYEKFIQFIQIFKSSYKHVDFIASCFDCNGISSGKRCLPEKLLVMKKYFSQHEIINTYNRKLSFWKKVFSIDNFFCYDGKVVTIFGFHIFFKPKAN